jgi:hypothetical protein
MIKNKEQCLDFPKFTIVVMSGEKNGKASSVLVNSILQGT